MQAKLCEMKKRNYQIDILKFFCAILVLICHVPVNPACQYFTEERTTVFGWMSVQIFFAVSGFFMVQGVLNKNLAPDDAGRFSLNYVINKFKRIVPQYIIATLMIVAMYMYICNTDLSYSKRGIQPFDLVIRAIPELFGVIQSGIDIRYNWPVWYISALLISMLPLVYFLVKNKDFFIYIFSPLATLLGVGFMYGQGDAVFAMYREWYGFIMGGVIRAVSSLCMGVVAHLIYEKFSSVREGHYTKILFTLAEVLIGLVFFGAWLINPISRDTLFSVLLLLPILLAIIFSGKSYISCLFKFKCLRFAGPLSLAIYLNHYAAVLVVSALISEKSYFSYVILTVVLTAVFATANFITVKIIKQIFNRLKEKN